MTGSGPSHVERLRSALNRFDVSVAERWGRRLAVVVGDDGKLLAAGNGGSAAEAQHLVAELVGRLRDDRPPLPALTLHADGPGITALGNDYGFAEVFARQVRAHGRPGDVLLLLSTSGRSENVLRAARAGHAAGLTVWGLTGPVPNPLADLCDEVLAVDADDTTTVQEVHLVAIHVLCEELDAARASRADDGSREHRRPLVVVGDALLDNDISGTVRRVSAEVQVPVVDDAVSMSRPGGAGLAAALAARGDRPVVLVTALAQDREGRELAGLLRGHGVEVIDLGSTECTTVKYRVRAGGRTLLLLSRDPQVRSGPSRPLTAAERDRVLGAAAVLVSDYGRGVTHDPSVREAVTSAASRLPTVWDPHPDGAEPVWGVRLVTPNAVEAAHFTGSATAGLVRDVGRAETLRARWAPAAVAVTRGAAGVVLLEPAGGSPVVVPVDAVGEGDACGAGDRFAVSVTAQLADRVHLQRAVTVAATVAADFVRAGGAAALDTAPPPRPDVVAARGRQAGGTAGSVVHGDVAAVLTRVAASGGEVVATGGCFDLLHSGHIALLDQARRLGDCLIVCLNDDGSVRRLKGEARPIVSQHDRAAVLASLGSVDAVVLFAEDTPETVLTALRPDVYVKGGDYRIEDVAEAELVATWGGRTVIVPYVEGRSTTGIIARIHGNPS